MKFLSAIFGLLLIVVSLVFALANRQSVTISFWPFDSDITAPLYLLTLGSLAMGLLLGGLFVWLSMIPHRFVARRLGKDVALLSDKVVELERELERHRAKQAEHAPPLLSGSKWRFWEKW